MRRLLHRADLQLAVRAAAAAGLAALAAQLLGLPYPIYALISAVIVTELEPAKTRALALPRLASTALGSLPGALAAPYLSPSAWALALVVLVGMLLASAVRLPAGSARMAGYVGAIVLLSHGTDPWHYSFFRVAETALGIGAAWLVALVPKLLPPEQDGTP